MRIVEVRPETGQFVEVWEYANEIWSQTLRWNEGQLELYNDPKDVWEAYDLEWSADAPKQYIIL